MVPHAILIVLRGRGPRYSGKVTSAMLNWTPNPHPERNTPSYRGLASFPVWRAWSPKGEMVTVSHTRQNHYKVFSHDMPRDLKGQTFHAAEAAKSAADKAYT